MNDGKQGSHWMCFSLLLWWLWWQAGMDSAAQSASKNAFLYFTQSIVVSVSCVVSISRERASNNELMPRRASP